MASRESAVNDPPKTSSSSATRRRRAPTQHTLYNVDTVHPEPSSAPMDADLEAEIARVHALALGANSAADEAIEDVVAVNAEAGALIGSPPARAAWTAPTLVRGSSVQAVDALKAEALQLKRQASAGSGCALGLAVSKLREAKALEGAVRRSADPAVGAAVAERVMAKLERTASEQHIAAVSRATLTAADLADDALLGELAMLQAEDGLIADEGLTEELDRTAAEHWALLKDAVTAGGVAKFWQKEGLEGAVRKEVRSPAARSPPARRA